MFKNSVAAHMDVNGKVLSVETIPGIGMGGMKENSG
jgi:hypothetical protein